MRDYRNRDFGEVVFCSCSGRGLGFTPKQTRQIALRFLDFFNSHPADWQNLVFTFPFWSDFMFRRVLLRGLLVRFFFNRSCGITVAELSGKLYFGCAREGGSGLPLSKGGKIALRFLDFFNSHPANGQSSHLQPTYGLTSYTSSSLSKTRRNAPPTDLS